MHACVHACVNVLVYKCVGAGGSVDISECIDVSVWRVCEYASV